MYKHWYTHPSLQYLLSTARSGCPMSEFLCQEIDLYTVCQHICRISCIIYLPKRSKSHTLIIRFSLHYRAGPLFPDIIYDRWDVNRPVKVVTTLRSQNIFGSRTFCAHPQGVAGTDGLQKTFRRTLHCGWRWRHIFLIHYTFVVVFPKRTTV